MLPSIYQRLAIVSLLAHQCTTLMMMQRQVNTQIHTVIRLEKDKLTLRYKHVGSCELASPSAWLVLTRVVVLLRQGSQVLRQGSQVLRQTSHVLIRKIQMLG